MEGVIPYQPIFMWDNYSKRQGRIIHCAVCTMGRPPRSGGPRSTVIFYHAVLTFADDFKKVVDFLGEEKWIPRERKSWLRVWKKDPRLTLAWGPWMVNPALVNVLWCGINIWTELYLVLSQSIRHLTDRRTDSFLMASTRLKCWSVSIIEKALAKGSEGCSDIPITLLSPCLRPFSLLSSSLI